MRVSNNTRRVEAFHGRSTCGSIDELGRADVENLRRHSLANLIAPTEDPRHTLPVGNDVENACGSTKLLTPKAAIEPLGLCVMWAQ